MGNILIVLLYSPVWRLSASPERHEVPQPAPGPTSLLVNSQSTVLSVLSASVVPPSFKTFCSHNCPRDRHKQQRGLTHLPEEKSTEVNAEVTAGSPPWSTICTLAFSMLATPSTPVDIVGGLDLGHSACWLGGAIY